MCLYETLHSYVCNFENFTIWNPRENGLSVVISLLWFLKTENGSPLLVSCLFFFPQKLNTGCCFTHFSKSVTISILFLSSGFSMVFSYHSVFVLLGGNVPKSVSSSSLVKVSIYVMLIRRFCSNLVFLLSFSISLPILTQIFWRTNFFLLIRPFKFPQSLQVQGNIIFFFCGKWYIYLPVFWRKWRN